jgi:hypothetical protein
MRETIEWLITEMDLLLKCEGKEIYDLAIDCDLHFGVCYKLMGTVFEEFASEISSKGKEIIKRNINSFNADLMPLESGYWFFIACDLTDTCGSVNLARESLEARKLVLEEILKTL